MDQPAATADRRRRCAGRETALTAGGTYYLTPKYSRVGYQPLQPVAFPIASTVTQLGLDCRYCHNGVEKFVVLQYSRRLLVHELPRGGAQDDPKLALVRESYQTGKPIPWVHIHKTPDYVYFNHSVHVTRALAASSATARSTRWTRFTRPSPSSMSFCLECHRDPAAHIRPVDKVTDLDWNWSADPKKAAELSTRERDQTCA